MKRENHNKCSRCNKLLISILSLDCGHSICPSCLQNFLKEEEKKQSLKDQLEIQCGMCSYITQIAITLAYKIVRPGRERQLNKHSKHCRSMLCMDCLEGCFPIQQYLGGHHEHHQVLPLPQAYTKIKDMLFYLEKQLQESVSKSQFQTQKLVHCKSMFNDIFNANIIKIKIGFDHLRQEIIKKQMQYLDYYEQLILQWYSSIDENIENKRKYVELCRYHLQNMAEKIELRTQDCLNNQIMLQTVNYFLENHLRFNQLSQKSQNQYFSYDYIEQMQEHRQAVNLENLRKIEKSIRTLEVFRFNQKSQTTSTCSLSMEYFDNKRKEVFNSSFDQEYQSKSMKMNQFYSIKKLNQTSTIPKQYRKIERLRKGMILRSN